MGGWVIVEVVRKGIFALLEYLLKTDKCFLSVLS